jgi:hypothetical protein
MVQLPEELSVLVYNPGRGENEKSLISEYYNEERALGHVIQSGNCLLVFIYTYETSSTRPGYPSMKEDN